jgi:hypothetical protein
MNFHSSSQNIGWLRDRYIEGTLIIKPPFQRKPVWAARQKCYLVESILMGLPVPEIYIQQTVPVEGNTRYAVVDGQQRVRTVLQFIGSEIDPEQQDYNRFVLDKLDVTSPWSNMSFEDLASEKKREFLQYHFSTRLLDTDSDEEVRDMFKRLNKYLTPLNAQELRNAMYCGPFVSLVERLGDDDYWVENKIISTAQIRRMGDLEFVSELLIGVLHGPQGGSGKIVDAYYEQYEDFDDEFPEQKRAVRLFEKTKKTVKKVLPDIRPTRWSNKTDFYTLFVALAQLLRTNDLKEDNVSALSEKLRSFAEEIDLRTSNEEAVVSREAINYVRNVRKGANDKSRRGERHVSLTKIIKEFFN